MINNQRISARNNVKTYQLLRIHPGDGDVSIETLVEVLEKNINDVTAELRILIQEDQVVETEKNRYKVAESSDSITSTTDGDKALLRQILDFYTKKAVAASLAWMPTRGWLQELWPDLDASEKIELAHAQTWMKDERHNFVAITQSAYETGQYSWACQLCVALWPLHEQNKLSHDLRQVNEIGILAAQKLHDDLILGVLRSQLGFAFRQTNDLEAAAASFTLAQHDASKANSLTVEATATESLGLTRMDQQQWADAHKLLRHNLELANQINQPRRLALAKFHLAKLEQGELALELLQQANDTLSTLPSPEDYTLEKITFWRDKKRAEMDSHGADEKS